jgi:hypothetical protein
VAQLQLVLRLSLGFAGLPISIVGFLFSGVGLLVSSGSPLVSGGSLSVKGGSLLVSNGGCLFGGAGLRYGLGLIALANVGLGFRLIGQASLPRSLGFGPIYCPQRIIYFPAGSHSRCLGHSASK